VGYGGKTINTLRLWEAAASDYFNFQEFSSGDFVGALAETLEAESLTRVLYPDDHTSQGQGLRFVQEYFLVACSLADLVRRFRKTNTDWRTLPDKVAIQLNDTHPTMAVPELMRILLDEAHLGWDEAWDLTKRLWPTPITRYCPKLLRNGRSSGLSGCCRVIWRSLRNQSPPH
jgi:starch phosphorylase